MHNQMNTIHHTSYALAVLLLMATALAGCRDSFSDRDLPTPAQTETGAPDGTIEVRLPYAAPLMSTSTTLRAMTPQDECAIDATRSRLFVFDSTGTLLYEAPITSVRPDGTEKGKYDKGTVTAFLKEGDGLKLALYANLDPAQMKTPVADMSREQITKLFTFALATKTPTRLPMWGELDRVTVSHTLVAAGKDAVQTITRPIKMLRSVARIDVGLNLSGTAFNETSSPLTGPIFDAKQGKNVEATYKIKSIRVFNASDKGQVSPLDASYNADDGKVTALSLPAGVTAATATPTYSSKTGAGSLLREIYLPETDNPNPDGEISADKKTLPEDEKQHLARPYLILELTNDKESGKSHFFRLDFLKYSEKVRGDKSIEEQTDAKVTYSYLPLLRNFRYKINITKIGGPGFDSIKDAQKGSAADIQYNVFVISEDDLGEVMYDGKYTLSVTEKEFSVGKYGSQPVYKAQTTWPGGWEIEVPKKIPGTTEKNNLYAATAENKSSWVKFKTTSGSVNEISSVIQTILPNDKESSVPRTGYFYVKAGRMRWLITIHQSNKADLAISLWQDPEAKHPLEYIELHQHGLSVNPTDAQSATERPVETARGYRRIYVKTDPYVDPNGKYFKDGFRPVLKRAGRDDVFYFWDYTEATAKGDMATKSPDEETLKKAFAATAGVPTSPWSQPSAGGKHRYFRYTGNNNVWECIVTVARAGISENPFEYYTDIYNFSISDGKEEATAELTLSQIEYNAEPSDGPNLADRYRSVYEDGTVRHETAFKPLFALDGQQHSFYMNANTPYTVELLKKGNYDLISAFGNQAGGIATYTDEQPTKQGEKLLFNLKDPSSVTLPAGDIWVEFRVTSPLNKFSPYTFRIYLVKGIKQPEANCYMIKKGETTGLFIPVSRVNTAADYYDQLLEKDVKLSGFPKGDFHLNRLSDDDEFEPFLVWTDMHNPDATGGLAQAGIAKLERQGRGNEGFVYIQLSGKPMIGSALIAIRSSKIPGKPILWSWHIWVVSEYPSTIKRVTPTNVNHTAPLDATSDITATPSPASIVVMDRLLGANKPATYNFQRHPDVYGYMYQMGRKDPFPSWKVIMPRTTWSNGQDDLTTPKQYWDGDGKRFFFEYHTKGDRSNAGDKTPLEGYTDGSNANAAAGATMTMKESIDHPESSDIHQTTWLYEQTPFFESFGDEMLKRRTFHYLWNRYDKALHPDLSNGHIDHFNRYGGKTVFDPSPYGWRIPSYTEAGTVLGAFSEGRILTPQPSLNYDGSYTVMNNELVPPGDKVANYHWTYISAIANSRKNHGLYYLLNTDGKITDWSRGSSGSIGDERFRRACGISVLPVLNPDEPNSTKYLPGYGK